MKKVKKIISYLLIFITVISSNFLVANAQQRYALTTGASFVQDRGDNLFLRTRYNIDFRVHKEVMDHYYKIREYMWDNNVPFNGGTLKEEANKLGLTTKRDYVYNISYNEELARLSLQRGLETKVHGKIEHLRPTGEIFPLFNKNGVSISAENLAWGTPSMAKDFDGWMYGELEALKASRGYPNSENGHLHLLINPSFKSIGFSRFYEVGVALLNRVSKTQNIEPLVGEYELEVEVPKEVSKMNIRYIKTENSIGSDKLEFDTTITNKNSYIKEGRDGYLLNLYEFNDSIYAWLLKRNGIKPAPLYEVVSGGKSRTFVIGTKDVDKNNIGWMYIDNNWYYLEEAKKLSIGWRYINGSWYFFDIESKMKTGWIKDGGVWYYLASSGAMQTGWIKDAGVWYYLSSSGAMQIGWIKDAGVWYYLASSGAMQTGWIKDAEVWYYLASSGAMRTGWIKDAGVWYYLTSSGAMQTGWIKDGGVWYYLSSSGAMQTGWIKDGGVWYYLSSSGALQ